MKYILPLICLLCTACVTAQPTAAKIDPAEIAKGRAELLECGRSVLPEIDDGVSPANVIAAAIPSLCQIESYKMIELALQGNNDPRTREAVTLHARSGKSFIPVVLQYRANR